MFIMFCILLILLITSSNFSSTLLATCDFISEVLSIGFIASLNEVLFKKLKVCGFSLLFFSGWSIPSMLDVLATKSTLDNPSFIA